MLVSFHDLAKLELNEAAAYYEHESAGLGQAFITEVGHGAILDQQTAAITTPSGVHRYVRPQPSKVVDLLELSWFAMNGNIGSRR